MTKTQMQKKLKSLEYIFLYNGPSYETDHMIGVLGRAVSPPPNRPADRPSGPSPGPLPSPAGYGVGQEFFSGLLRLSVRSPSGSWEIEARAGGPAQVVQPGAPGDVAIVPRHPCDE